MRMLQLLTLALLFTLITVSSCNDDGGETTTPSGEQLYINGKIYSG